MSLSPPLPPFNSSDPTATFLSSSTLDFLLIELVPLAHRITTERDFASPSAAPASASASASAADTAGLQSPPHSAATAKSETTSGTVVVGDAAAAAAGGDAPKRIDDEEHLDAVHYRLESQGYRVGQGLVERFSRDRPRFNDTLDVIKFLCKDLWSLVFGKNIDNLKTNHRGVYVLTDNAFRPFSRMSTETGSHAIVRAQPFLWFPCGIIRGALAALGINATVQAEVNELPGAIFQIKTIPAKP
ncbi:trafficking protein particle complex subunit 6B [Trichoderma asperellum]|uniref:Trafficking protein particle complex subunit 6B n=1 Tax=Trichoderma asperellum TaxID=101201 RepID=A0A6V8R342_TRIAP|nr:trafficking protein particle complex subunit 6B [Trichoderma asperellum]